MSLDERFVLLVIAFVVGCVVGYLTRMLTEIKKEIKELPHTPSHPRDEAGYNRVQATNHVLLAIIVILTAFAAFKSQHAVNQIKQNAHENIVSLCRSGTETRNTQRDLVEAIYKLATGAVQRNPGRRLSAEEVTRINAYIRNASDFRDGMYKKIQPSDTCRPYVSDVGVRPPTEPFPYLPIPKGAN